MSRFRLVESAHDLGALARYHEFTREHQAHRLVYRLTHWVLKPLLVGYFRLTRTRMEEIPPEGALLIVANHRSFLDPFLIGTLLPSTRPVCFMGKAELFARPRAGWYLSRCGCFPVRRGESDPDAMETARQVLASGGVVVIFPEGTRLRAGGVGRPRRGAFRLALQTGADVLPVCVIGSDRARRAKVIVRPVHCEVHAAPVVPVKAAEPDAEAVRELTEQAWSAIVQLWLAHGGSPEPGARDRPPLRERLRLGRDADRRPLRERLRLGRDADRRPLRERLRLGRDPDRRPLRERLRLRRRD
jgi:glycerol-3-phosphate dehydrogenase (NAD(P)+)